jgi:hypothetical protein
MNGVLGPDDEVKNTVRELLATNKVLSLGTSANDRPWVAGAYFAETDAFHLTPILEITGRSLANIRLNSNVAVSVATGSPFDVHLQGEGDAEVLADGQQLERQRTPCGRKHPRSNC